MIFDTWDDLRMHLPVSGTVLADASGELYKVPATWITGTTPILTKMGESLAVSPASDPFDHPIWPLTLAQVTKVGHLPRYDIGAHEGTCQSCHGPNIVWHTRSELWARVMDGEPEGIVCPVCFVRKAEAKGVKPASWVLSG